MSGTFLKRCPISFLNAFSFSQFKERVLPLIWVESVSESKRISGTPVHTGWCLGYCSTEGPHSAISLGDRRLEGQALMLFVFCTQTVWCRMKLSTALTLWAWRDLGWISVLQREQPGWLSAAETRPSCPTPLRSRASGSTCAQFLGELFQLNKPAENKKQKKPEQLLLDAQTEWTRQSPTSARTAARAASGTGERNGQRRVTAVAPRWAATGTRLHFHLAGLSRLRAEAQGWLVICEPRKRNFSWFEKLS